MITIASLVESVGDAVLRLIVAGGSAEVDDVTTAEPDELAAAGPGELVMGVGISEPSEALGLLEHLARAGARGVVLKTRSASDPRVIAAAERLGLGLVELQAHVSWTHVVWILRCVIDRAAAPGPFPLGEPGERGELFALADAAATIAGGPVTIEDPHSRVLAYSGGQESADPARVSSIVGRRVPEHIVAHQRARGVFRKLARSSEPLYVSAAPPDHTVIRLVVPARAGGEWLGSIWAAVAERIAPERIDELTKIASVLALHLLRRRAEADMSHRASTERVRAALQTTSPLLHAALWMPPGPWRVAALGVPAAIGDAGGTLDLWETITRRFGWKQPLLADLDGITFAIVTERGDQSTPGSLSWLRALIASVHGRDAELTAAIGGLAPDRVDLRRSRSEAGELCQLLVAGHLQGAFIQVEDAWSALTIARARAAVQKEGLLGGPLSALVAHDRDHGSAFVPTVSAWLDNPGDPRAAAAALHIHANTLRHRMRRIAELVPVDFAAPRVRLALQLQLVALEGDGQNDQSSRPDPLATSDGDC